MSGIASAFQGDVEIVSEVYRVDNTVYFGEGTTRSNNVRIQPASLVHDGRWEASVPMTYNRARLILGLVKASPSSEDVCGALLAALPASVPRSDARYKVLSDAAKKLAADCDVSTSQRALAGERKSAGAPQTRNSAVYLYPRPDSSNWDTDLEAESSWACRLIKSTLGHELITKLWSLDLREVTDHPYFQEVLVRDSAWRESDVGGMISTGQMHAFSRALTTTKFKEGMDVYMKRRMTDDVEISLVYTPNGERKRMIDRVKQDSRKTPLFKDRGRLDKQMEASRWKRARVLLKSYKRDAGLAQSTECANFFPDATLKRGMVLFKPDMQSGTVQAFRKAGLPFVAGISGSVEHLVLCLEEVTPQGEYGRVAEKATRDRLIAAYSAILIATGMHTLGECAAAATNLGYWGGDLAQLLRTGYTYIGEAFRAMGIPGLQLSTLPRVKPSSVSASCEEWAGAQFKHDCKCADGLSCCCATAQA